jgi:hypothetical protein
METKALVTRPCVSAPEPDAPPAQQGWLAKLRAAG